MEDNDADASANANADADAIADADADANASADADAIDALPSRSAALPDPSFFPDLLANLSPTPAPTSMYISALPLSAPPPHPARQVLIIAFGTVAFNDPTSTLNVIGFVVVVAASTNYSLLSISERKRGDAKLVEPPGNGKLPLLPK